MEKAPCQHSISNCIDSRMNEGYRYRRHKCCICDHRWSTVEVEVKNPRNGLLSGALAALYEKIGLSQNQARAIAILIDAIKIGERDE